MSEVGEGLTSSRGKWDFSKIDVNKFAKKYFNGGGHKYAAGGYSELSLEDTKAKLLKHYAEIL